MKFREYLLNEAVNVNDPPLVNADQKDMPNYRDSTNNAKFGTCKTIKW